MSPDHLNLTLAKLSDASWSIGALSAAVESGLVSALSEPRSLDELAAAIAAPVSMVRALVDVLVGLELARCENDKIFAADSLAAAVGNPFASRVLRDDLRRMFGQPRALIADARTGRLAPGWRHLDEDVIEAQGTFAELHTKRLFVEGIVPLLDGLGDRLSRDGGRVLDVGAGAAGNAIAFARTWPKASIVGLEPWQPSREIGLRNVKAAGLETRITIHDTRVEELAEDGVYDLVWLPQMFFDDATLTSGLAACRRALHPDGWLVTAWIADERATGLSGALARLRDVAFGGDGRGEATLRDRLRVSGFRDLRSVPFAGGSIGTLGGRA